MSRAEGQYGFEDPRGSYEFGEGFDIGKAHAWTRVKAAANCIAEMIGRSGFLPVVPMEVDVLQTDAAAVAAIEAAHNTRLGAQG